MLTLPSSIKPLFIGAGWQPIAQSPNELRAISAVDIAAAVIQEFGGLKVGETGAGREHAASDVCFYPSLQPEDTSLGEPWIASLGELSAVASAHHDHMVIFVDKKGYFYAFTDPDARLYCIGQSFGEAMERLLLGLTYGAHLPEDA